MMLRRLLTMMAVTLAVCACATTQNAPSGGTPDATQAAEQLRFAMITPDRATLEKLTSKDLSYGHSSGKVDTQASFIGDLLSGASDFVTIDITNQTVATTQNVTIIRHMLAAETNDGGKPGTVKLHVLQVWQQEAGAWKLVARQAVRPPQ
ncbi:MAG: nuclear transport factor 2 family protein [Rhodocyclaceae bacterium]